MTRALIVDDKQENLYLLRSLLQGHGFEVSEAPDGTRALEEARRQPPDVVISDLLMPLMDGYSLLREWKSDEQLKAIPFVVYTATYTDAQDEKLALDLGADAYIVKPAEPEPFMQRIWEVLTLAESGDLPPRRQSVAGEAALQRHSEVLNRKLSQRVAELAASQAQIVRLNHLYAALSETNQAIAHFTDRDTLFEKICRIAVERAGFALAWIGLLDGRSGEIVPTTVYGASEPWFSAMRPFSARAHRGVPVEIAVNERRIYQCNDLLNSPEHAAERDMLERSNLRAAVSLPLYLDCDVVGALTLFASEPGYFDEQRSALVKEIAEDLSFALEIFERDLLRRKAETELREANAELEARVQARTAELAAANRELEAFAYSVSHDLRAPLRMIDGFSKVLFDQYATKVDADGRLFMQQIHVHAERMTKLIDALLKLSTAGIQSMNLEHVDLSAMTRDIIANLVRAEPSRSVETHVEAGCTAKGDANLLNALLQNLLGNAFKYTARKPTAQVFFGSKDTAHGQAFYVQDNGSGFDMRHADKIFQPFQRLHSADEFEGTGVGLATAARIVARHGGRIWAESELAAGSTFYFTLA